MNKSEFIFKNISFIFVLFLCVLCLDSCDGNSFNDTFYEVSFYIDNNIYFSEKVMSGHRPSEIIAPNTDTYEFKYWVDENGDKFKINDKTKIYNDTNLYAYYEFNDKLAKSSINSKYISGNLLVKNNTDFKQKFLWFTWNSKVDAYGSATIFLKDNNTYYALTNAHVLLVKDKIAEQALDLSFFDIDLVDYKETTYSAEVLYYDVNYDLAILKFKSDEKYFVAPFATDEGSKGDKVIAVGNPKGKRNVITFGTKKDYVTEKIGASESVSNVSFETIKSSAKCKKGSSGGVLYNANLEIIGINYAVQNVLWWHYTNSIGVNKIKEFLNSYEF